MRYKAIVDQVITDINNGTLMLGQRMPSLRKLASQHQVSMTTALNSYRNLEACGWLVARPQSGFFVSTPRSPVKLPHQPQFISQSSSIKKSSFIAGREGFEHVSGPFGISSLAPHHLPVTELEKSIKRGMQSQGDNLHLYQDPQGLDDLRYALSSHFTQQGFPFKSEEVVITSGCLDAVRIALEITTEINDTIAISSPCFNGLLELLAHLKRKVIEIPCTEDGLDLHQLETLMKNGEVAAGLFSTSHMNPQGTSLTVQQKQTLATLANDYKIPIIEDDIYAELAYDKTMPLPVKSWDTNDYVLWCSSVSKTLSSGYRLGWCLPGRYKKEMIQHVRVNHLGTNSVVQSGVAHFVQSGQYQKHLNAIRNILFNNVCMYQNILQECLPAGSAISQPNGGIVLWVQVPQLNAEQLVKDAETINIDIRAGNFFTTRQLYRDCFRLNAGWSLQDNFDEKRTIEQALRELLSLVKKHTD